MPGPIAHVKISKHNAEMEGLPEELALQRVLGAIIPDVPIIENRIHSVSINPNGKYGDMLKGIMEHGETDKLYHESRSFLFAHEVKEIYDDFRLLLKEDGGRAKFCDMIIRSIDYGRRNMDEIGSVISDVCGSDYADTKEGMEKYLSVVEGYIKLLHRSTTLLGRLSSFTR